MSKGAQIALAAVAIAALLGWYATSSLEGAGTYRYFETLDELRTSDASGTHVRVHGFVAPGSIERDVPARAIRFSVQGRPPHEVGSQEAQSAPLAVVYGSLEVSDMFKDGAEVVVEGRLDGAAGVFHATNVLAKCPSKFQAQATPARS